ncbi:hypothetical protein K488DRAFT_45627 [Vararia minispora EC-137]|uniref:Uncharacterized protein n=1 Tax=Vararia minispora EC-137 TaxID=1314806 RepID=A0ACB8QSG6_9AGAM|nr:hypothetical protein K488DRAFT_45627 [Vararia minispora EC-137]
MAIVLVLSIALAALFLTPLISISNYPLFASHPLPRKISKQLSSLWRLPLLQSVLGLENSLLTSARLGNPATLGIATEIYVVSLPRRKDRRRQMDRLARLLSLNLTYISATDAQDPTIVSIQQHVALQTLGYSPPFISDYALRNATFEWPEDFDSEGFAVAPDDDRAGAELWDDTRPHLTSRGSQSIASLPQTCTTSNNLFPPPRKSPRLFESLDLPKLACWHSHLRVIRDIARQPDDGGVAIVLEDDVDMERDIIERLQTLWGALPADWDIVYLGHCWSDEKHHPPLRIVAPPFVIANHLHTSAQHNHSTLRPSYEPKCTHAYVLSRRGARRLRAYLRFVPFAYSRAIDQALSWLVHSGRVKAFSVVPPVVVQRKVGKSDLMPGMGSEWIETLYDGVLSGR